MKARIHRFVTWATASYISGSLGLVIISIFFWTSVGSPGALSSLLRAAGADEVLYEQLSAEQKVKVSVDTISSEIDRFSGSVHTWLIQKDRAAFLYTTSIAGIDDSNQINLDYVPYKSSFEYYPQRSYYFAKVFTLIAPIGFVGLSLLLLLLHKSKRYVLYRLERIFLLIGISSLASIPFLYAFWIYIASRLSSYPRATPIASEIIKPLTNVALFRYALLSIFFSAVYFSLHILIKKYLIKVKYEPPVANKKRSEFWWSSTKLGRMYLNKIFK